MSVNESCSPFLKWAGGKRWLAPKLTPLIQKELDKSNGEYIEPFLGAGAIFFALNPQCATLSDININLVEVYIEIRRNWLAIVNEIKTWPVNKEFYCFVRNKRPLSSFDRVCRFLYLNRTCYGGLYRENKSGQFNVPYGGGRDHHALWEKKLLQSASEILNGQVSIVCSDFEDVVNKSKSGDVVYCDPTYSTKKRKQFDRYGKTIFNWHDQVRLAITAERAMDRGVLVIVSNSGCFQLSQFYPKAYKITLEKVKNIGNKAKSESTHKESLFILDPYSRRKKWEELGVILNRKSSVSFSEKMLDSMDFNYQSLLY